MTPEEILKRVSSEKFVGNILAIAASKRPDNPAHQKQYDAAVTIVDLYSKRDLTAGEHLEAYVETYGQDPDCY